MNEQIRKEVERKELEWKQKHINKRVDIIEEEECECELDYIECELDDDSQRENLLHDIKVVRGLLDTSFDMVGEEIGYSIESEIYHRTYDSLKKIESDLFETLCNL